MIYEFLATGFEDIEALAPLDIIRRAGLEIKTVSITGEKIVYSAHGVGIEADALMEEVDLGAADMLLLPGGLPGSTNLDACAPLRQAILAHHVQGKPLAAICAAPMVYGHLGILQGVKATCYPGFETYLQGAEYTAALVEKDGNFITAKGPGAALEFAFAIVEKYCGAQMVHELKHGMMIQA